MAESAREKQTELKIEEHKKFALTINYMVRKLNFFKSFNLIFYGAPESKEMESQLYSMLEYLESFNKSNDFSLFNEDFEDDIEFNLSQFFEIICCSSTKVKANSDYEEEGLEKFPKYKISEFEWMDDFKMDFCKRSAKECNDILRQTFDDTVPLMKNLIYRIVNIGGVYVGTEAFPDSKTEHFKMTILV